MCPCASVVQLYIQIHLFRNPICKLSEVNSQLTKTGTVFGLERAGRVVCPKAMIVIATERG